MTILTIHSKREAFKLGGVEKIACINMGGAHDIFSDVSERGGVWSEKKCHIFKLTATVVTSNRWEEKLF